MSNKLNYIKKAIELIKRKKVRQYGQKIIQICKQEFGLSEKEVLDNLKEGIKRNAFEKVSNNKTYSYHMLKELVVKDKDNAVRGGAGEKNICNSITSGTKQVTTTAINVGSQTDIMISSREFQQFKTEVQQEMAKLKRDFNHKVNQSSHSKVPVFNSSMVLGSDDSNH